ncbi:NAD(P)/FAD-dependent oxidoreductase [Galbitalea soli]|uniref:FAD-dependent oxidoreductase n=1 Tax=Galbitalea soli TaxID=1268042 RepID=A0A7C9TS30_9MICO|nr:FAD-dependent oxidoreductase [Galbitalea soli]NEM91682.1 FAD-dependent oxidoreductase [Galbitalea soli]NYJ30378.1 glycine/D-amino acid oxidase-like deaminating enzyme [Galbitalea soli]
MGSTVFDRNAPHPGLVADSLAGSRLHPFWLEGLDSPTFPRFSGRGVYDLVVVGGGYTGLWTALQAKQRDPGRRVALVEGKTIGWAASGRNGGFVEASLTHGESNGSTRFPGELEQLDRLGMENLDEIEATVAELGWDCDFQRTGSLAVATEEYQVEELRAAHDGVTEYFFEGAEIRAELGSPTYLAGLWSTRATALVHPGKLARELALACAAAGVELFEKSPVTGLGETLEGMELRTPHGTLAGRRVALATNAFPSLLRRFRLHTVPVYDYVLMTEPLSAEQLESIGWENRQGVADLGNQFHYYRLSADNRILWGGYDAIYHYGGRIRTSYEDRTASFERLAAHFFTTFPQLAGLRFTNRWAGVIDTSTRFCAFFAQAHGGRVSYAAGFTGLGVAATRFAANVMLDQLAGERTERTELDMVSSIPLPFPPEPAAYLGVQATRWALDRADHNDGRRNLLLRTLDAVGLGFDS